MLKNLEKLKSTCREATLTPLFDIIFNCGKNKANAVITLCLKKFVFCKIKKFVVFENKKLWKDQITLNQKITKILTIFYVALSPFNKK